MNKVKEKEKGGEKQYYLNIQESKLCHSLFLSLNINHWDQIGKITPNVFFLWRVLYPAKCLIFQADKQVDNMDLL